MHRLTQMRWMGGIPAVGTGRYLVKINRSFVVGFAVSAAVSAILAQLLADSGSHVITSVTMAVGYVIFYAIFATFFYAENHRRLASAPPGAARRELLRLATSFGAGELGYLVMRWVSLFYLLELGVEPYLASLASEVVCTLVYMLTVSLVLRAARTH